MRDRREDKRVLQWHPAFYASQQIELQDEADKLLFENEHQLGTKPKAIDVQIIVTSKLSQDVNLWLRNLTNDIREQEAAQRLLREYLLQYQSISAIKSFQIFIKCSLSVDRHCV